MSDVPDQLRGPAGKVHGGPHRLLRIAQAAEEMSVSRSTLARLMATKKIRTVRLAPQIVRIPAAEIDAYIERKLAGQPPGDA